MFKRVLAGAGAATLAAGLALASIPAQADIDGNVTVDAVTGAKTETVTVEDGGGVDYKISIRWNEKYKDAAGNWRVSVSNLRVERPSGQAPAADDGLDAHFDVQQGESHTIIQHRVYDGLDLDGTPLSATFNPRNPRSDVGDTRIRIKVGTDDDGEVNSRWVYLYQPSGLPVRGL